VCYWAQRCGKRRNGYTDQGTSTCTFAQVSALRSGWLVGWSAFSIHCTLQGVTSFDCPSERSNIVQLHSHAAPEWTVHSTSQPRQCWKQHPTCLELSASISQLHTAPSLPAIHSVVVRPAANQLSQHLAASPHSGPWTSSLMHIPAAHSSTFAC